MIKLPTLYPCAQASRKPPSVVRLARVGGSVCVDGTGNRFSTRRTTSSSGAILLSDRSRGSHRRESGRKGLSAHEERGGIYVAAFQLHSFVERKLSGKALQCDRRSAKSESESSPEDRSRYLGGQRLRCHRALLWFCGRVGQAACGARPKFRTVSICC